MYIMAHDKSLCKSIFKCYIYIAPNGFTIFSVRVYVRACVRACVCMSPPCQEQNRTGDAEYVRYIVQEISWIYVTVQGQG